MNVHPHTLIVGLGSEILGDDGIGHRIVEKISLLLNNPGILFDTALCGGLDLLNAITGYDNVVLIDAIKGFRHIGNVESFPLEQFKETLHLSNVHEGTFKELYLLGEMLGYKMPGNVLIISVEITENEVFSEILSPEISCRFENICSTVIGIIQEKIHIPVTT